MNNPHLLIRYVVAEEVGVFFYPNCPLAENAVLMVILMEHANLGLKFIKMALSCIVQLN